MFLNTVYALLAERHQVDEDSWEAFEDWINGDAESQAALAALLKGR